MSAATATVTLDELTLADRPERWERLGFALSGGGVQIGRVRLGFAGAEEREQPGCVLGWSLRAITSTALDGLRTSISEAPVRQAAAAHPNGVLALDHVVAFSPDLDRTVAALQAAGLDLRRVREEPTPAGAPRQAFFRLGEEILEVVQAPQEAVERLGGRERPARFWGLAMVVDDLDAAVARLGEHAGTIRPAVQQGRRIATLRRSAGLSVPLALMSAARVESAA